MARQMKVGLFVLLGLGLLAVAVFLIGQNRRFWEPKVTYKGAFRDVSGLKPGAPVRTGGLDIGAVTTVGHGSDANDTRIYVTLEISKSEASRIREDTVARVAPKGLLGDKMVELSVADGERPPQDPKKLLITKEPEDMFATVDQLATRVKAVVEGLTPLAKSLGDPKFADDIKGSAESTRKILDGLANQDSVAHRMMFDPNEAQKVDNILSNVQAATNQLNGVLADMHEVSTHAKEGPGLVHSLVYDGDIAADAAGTVNELHQDMLAVRQGNGLAHNILYGDDSGQHMMANLNKMSDDLRDIVGNIKAGKGTIGALLVDPSIYEDLKSAVGNVERNQVLRALVRYSIKADETKPHVDTPATP